MKIVNSIEWTGEKNGEAPPPDLEAARRNLQMLAPRARQAFLLIAVEDFSPREAALVLDVDSEELQRLVDEAGREIARQIATDVVVIEDEPLIALDLQRIVTSLGHRVVKIARTERQAIDAVKRAQPGLILADIQLADGSSGLDAVNEILRSFSVPVVFVTAYPQRLLTGTRPEPTFLITKPFHPDNVKGNRQPGAVLRHSRSAGTAPSGHRRACVCWSVNGLSRHRAIVALATRRPLDLLPRRPLAGAEGVTAGRSGKQRGARKADADKALAIVIPPRFSTMQLDILRFFFIDVREFIACLRLGMKQFVELRLDCLRVAILGTLYEKRHEPCGERGNGVPIERCALEDEPGNAVGSDDEKSQWMCGQDTDLSEPAPHRLNVHGNPRVHQHAGVAGYRVGGLGASIRTFFSRPETTRSSRRSERNW